MPTARSCSAESSTEVCSPDGPRQATPKHKNTVIMAASLFMPVKENLRLQILDCRLKSTEPKSENSKAKTGSRLSSAVPAAHPGPSGPEAAGAQELARPQLES